MKSLKLTKFQLQLFLTTFDIMGSLYIVTKSIQNIVQNQWQPLIVVNNSPENQLDFCRLKTVAGEKSYSDEVKDRKENENKIVIFSDSIEFIFIDIYFFFV